jgi:hypothetical protein
MPDFGSILLATWTRVEADRIEPTGPDHAVILDGQHPCHLLNCYKQNCKRTYC